MVTGGEDKKLVVWDLPSMTVRSQTTTDKKIVGAVLDLSGSSVCLSHTQTTRVCVCVCVCVCVADTHTHTHTHTTHTKTA
jgi:hypothetical protein